MVEQQSKRDCLHKEDDRPALGEGQQVETPSHGCGPAGSGPIRPDELPESVKRASSQRMPEKPSPEEFHEAMAQEQKTEEKIRGAD